MRERGFQVRRQRHKSFISCSRAILFLLLFSSALAQEELPGMEIKRTPRSSPPSENVCPTPFPNKRIEATIWWTGQDNVNVDLSAFINQGRGGSNFINAYTTTPYCTHSGNAVSLDGVWAQEKIVCRYPVGDYKFEAMNRGIGSAHIFMMAQEFLDNQVEWTMGPTERDLPDGIMMTFITEFLP